MQNELEFIQPHGQAHDSRNSNESVCDSEISEPLTGYLDSATRTRVTGWAFEPEHPDSPVLLEIMDGDMLLLRVSADQYRADVAAARYVHGRVGFDVKLPQPLSDAITHQIHVRRVSDQLPLHWSPRWLPARLETLSHTSTDISFALDHSLRRLNEVASAPMQSPPIAVVSCMPPAETGIATATLLTFREAIFPVDIYAPYSSAEDYLGAITDDRLADTRVRVFHLAALALGQHAVSYRAQLYALGNSDHNVPVVRALRRNRHFPPPCRVGVHLHDPNLLNVLDRIVDEEKRELSHVIKSFYGVDLGDDPAPERLVEAGILGVRAVLDGIDVDAVIVNSPAAAELVRRELPDHRVEVLFHPVFDVPAESDAPRKQGLRIGTLGVPGEAKRTEVVVEAFELVKRQLPEARLVIAGYEASRFAQRMNLVPEHGYEIHDSPADREFARLITSLDIAVQLRHQNLGENSGVVARLAGLDIPVITSPVPAFREYEQFANVLDSHDGAEELAAMIIRMLETKQVSEGRAAYVASHRPGAFCARLYELLA
jgi:glycosyltransferase involved in cell wall biosynthesis